MLNDLELDLALALLNQELVLRVRLLIAEGWYLEAKRILQVEVGGPRGAEILASMIKRMVVS